MPQVASELKSHALSRSLSHAIRPPQAADRAPASPFESLLDEAAAPAPEPRERAADDSAPRADRPQKNPAKSADKSDKVSKSDDNAEPAEGEKADETAAPADAVEAVSDGQPVVDAETVELPEAGDILKTEGDDIIKQVAEGKPVETVTPAAATIVPVVDETPAPTGANAIAVAVEGPAAPAVAPAAMLEAAAAALDATSPAAALDATTEPTTPETGKTAIVAASTPKAPPDVLAALQGKPEKKTDGEKPAVDAKAPPKAPAPQFALDAKAAPASAEASKDAVPQAHVEANAEAPTEAAAKGHRNASAEFTVTGAAAAADNHAAVPKVAADTVQPLVLTTPAPAVQAQAPAQAAAPAAVAQLAPQAAAVPIAGVAIEITNKALTSTNHFEIRLDPPELGRIQVNLEVDRDGNVTSRLIADRPDTLDLLRRDTAGLERALQDAGLKTANNSLQFSLRDQSANQQQNGNSGANTAQLVLEDETLPVIEAAQYARLGGRAGGIDISV